MRLSLPDNNSPAAKLHLTPFSLLLYSPVLQLALLWAAVCSFCCPPVHATSPALCPTFSKPSAVHSSCNYHSPSLPVRFYCLQLCSHIRPRIHTRAPCSLWPLSVINANHKELQKGLAVLSDWGAKIYIYPHQTSSKVMHKGKRKIILISQGPSQGQGLWLTTNSSVELVLNSICMNCVVMRWILFQLPQRQVGGRKKGEKKREKKRQSIIELEKVWRKKTGTIKILNTFLILQPWKVTNERGITVL